MTYYESIRRLPQYVRAGISVFSLCGILAGCSSKSGQVKAPEPVAPVAETAPIQMPELAEVPETSTLTYSPLSETESKTPVRPHRQRVNVQRPASTTSLETSISATNTAASESPNNTTPLAFYTLLGTTGACLIFALYFALRSRKREEDSSQQH